MNHSDHFRRSPAPSPQPRAGSRQDRSATGRTPVRPIGERPSIRREAPPLPVPIEPTADQLQLRLAEELDYARRMLVLMGDELSADRTVVIRHSAAIVSIDVVRITLGHIADIVRASEPEEVVSRMTMCDLKARLTREGGL